MEFIEHDFCNKMYEINFPEYMKYISK